MEVSTRSLRLRDAETSAANNCRGGHAEHTEGKETETAPRVARRVRVDVPSDKLLPAAVPALASSRGARRARDVRGWQPGWGERRLRWVPRILAIEMGPQDPRD